MTVRRLPSRRSFLAQSAAAAAATWAAPAFLRAGSANERLNLAFIGVGGRGGHNLGEIAGDRENVVAICDVDANALGRAGEKYPAARKYDDFRKLFETTNDIDAVVVSTCEHTHSFATLPALLLGKHVYCEKPLTHNVVEARKVAQAAAKAKVVTQMGTQMHATENYRRVVELIQSGAIGPVTDCHVWVSRAWGRQTKEESDRAKDIVFVTERPTEAQTPPAHLNWDLWVGPAPQRPYSDVYFPGPKWYRWWDFGNGTMSDLGSHWVDLPFWALELDAPKTIEAMGDPPHPEIAPASMTAVYEYGARGDKPACKLTWHQGFHKPQIWKDGGIPQWSDGVLFVGEKGMLLSDYGKHVLLPEEKFADFKAPEPFLRVSPGHHAEWVIACKTGSPTGSPFDYAGPLTEANHLGNVAYRAGRKIEWDAANLKIPNYPDAERFLDREARGDWGKT